MAVILVIGYTKWGAYSAKVFGTMYIILLVLVFHFSMPEGLLMALIDTMIMVGLFRLPSLAAASAMLPLDTNQRQFRWDEDSALAVQLDTLSGDKARIEVTRPKAAYGFAVAMELWANDVFLDKIRNGQVKTFEVDACETEVSVWRYSQDARATRVLKGGHAYAIEVGIELHGLGFTTPLTVHFVDYPHARTVSDGSTAVRLRQPLGHTVAHGHEPAQGDAGRPLPNG